MNKSNTIDEYIASFPPSTQVLLQQVRSTIRHAAPDALEIINYGIPTFTYFGNLVHFGAYKNHIGFYSLPSGNKAFEDEISVYKTGNGSIQFPLDQPMPFDLIARMVEFRIKENLEKEAKRKQKKNTNKKIK